MLRAPSWTAEAATGASLSVPGSSVQDALVGILLLRWCVDQEVPEVSVQRAPWQDS